MLFEEKSENFFMEIYRNQAFISFQGVILFPQIIKVLYNAGFYKKLTQFISYSLSIIF